MRSLAFTLLLTLVSVFSFAQGAENKHKVTWNNLDLPDWINITASIDGIQINGFSTSTALIQSTKDHQTILSHFEQLFNQLAKDNDVDTLYSTDLIQIKNRYFLSQFIPPLFYTMEIESSAFSTKGTLAWSDLSSYNPNWKAVMHQFNFPDNWQLITRQSSNDTLINSDTLWFQVDHHFNITFEHAESRLRKLGWHHQEYPDQPEQECAVGYFQKDNTSLYLSSCNQDGNSLVNLIKETRS